MAFSTRSKQAPKGHGLTGSSAEAAAIRGTRELQLFERPEIGSQLDGLIGNSLS